MGVLGTIGSPLLNLVKGIALKDLKKWADENLGRGPAALGPVSSDIEKLTVEVYRYSATIKTAAIAADMPRSSASDAARLCTNSFSLNEVQTAQEIVQHLQAIRSRLSGLVENAAGRAQSDANALNNALQEAQAGLDYTSRQGNQQGVRSFSSELQRYTGMQVFAQQNMILIRRRGSDLTATLDSLIGEMQTNIALLQAASGKWLQASTECWNWQVQMTGSQ